jgi:hypothetical protein
MKNRCFSSARALSLTILCVVLIPILWPTAGFGQRSSRREASSRSRSAAVESADPNAGTSGSDWAGYAIILSRNIFSRTRVSARQQRVREEPRPTVRPNPEAYHLLKGVVQENDDFIAFIENTQTGAVLQLRRGDAVARGTIKTLTLDGLEYEMEDKTTVVGMGSDLEGGRGVMTTGQVYELAGSVPASTGQPAQARPAATPAPSGDTDDIIKRLMEQRQRQLGQ